MHQNQLIPSASVPVIKLEMQFTCLLEDLASTRGGSTSVGDLKIGKIKQTKIDLIINDNQQIDRSVH